jgi:Ala-tRNA(Pro) deacylase
MLSSLKIDFNRYEHPPVFTIEEAKQHWADIPGTHCKNLFLRNKKGSRHYLLTIEQSKSADLKELTRQLGEDRLSFASGERLMRHLGLETGAVSPFGLINDQTNSVQVLVDEELQDAVCIFFHPNVNTATVGLSFYDFERFLEYSGNPFRYISV